MLRLFAAAVLAVTTFLAAPLPVQSATLDLGGIRIRLPSVKSTRSGSGVSSQVRSHPRWFTSVQEGHSYATNGQGIWITYDDSGALAFQMELGVATTLGEGNPVPIDIRVNGRPFALINGVVANANLVVVKGGEIDMLTERLKTGRTVSLAAAGNFIETHLSGSSAAIRDVEAAAALQRRLFATGQVAAAKPDAKPQAEDGVRYFLPGANWQDTGAVDVTYFIAQDRGLVLRIGFAQIRPDLGPEHRIDLLPAEARRAIALLRKGEEWTQIARDNRVGLFSKRIGFFDEANSASAPEADQPQTGETNAEQAAAPTVGAGAGQPASGNAAKASQPANAPAGNGETPADFMAVNFNSYESGETSVQIEHAVHGFSRRFNFFIAKGKELADILEATIKKAEFDLESRKFTQEQKSKLFQ
ncbi:MAG: hypothetical protein H6884_07160 [Rhodobiaceae bacterium]|nr:hypothetical protein [Rhodobiaceae bacterium]